MGNKVKIAGEWRDVSMPYTKVAGTWKTAKAVYNKVDGSWRSSFLQGGVNDFGFATYDINNKLNGVVGTVNGLPLGAAVRQIGNEAIKIQADGKILIVGAFTAWSGKTVNRIVRLNADGTIDAEFSANTSTAANGIIYAIAIQSDGKIILGGEFTTWNGTTVNSIVRLNTNGTRDTAFTTNTGTAANSRVQSIAIQNDGKILLGGAFTAWSGTTVNYIVRLNTNGTRDTAFTTNTGTAANGAIYAIAVQSDGKILLGGAFTTWSGTTVNRIVRLNANGTREAAFTTNAGTASNNIVRSIAIQSDGKILLGGTFTTWIVTTVNRIVRLNADGTRDTAFTTNTGSAAGSNVNSIAIQPDGKILIVGAFTTWSGTTVNRIVRLNANGTRDTAFTTNTGTAADGGVSAIAIQSDGKIILGGEFATFNGTIVNSIVRLNADGTMSLSDLLTEAALSANNFIYAIAVQSDGKILLGGAFTTWNGATVNRIVRLNTDGTRDTAFTTNTGTAANNLVYAIAVQSDGKILVGGFFVTWNGATVNYIVRLNADGTRDTAFTTNTGNAANSLIYAIAVQSDGKILVGGFFTTWNGATVNYIVRLNADGTRDTAFTTNTGAGANGGVFSIAVQSDGKILVGGTFTTWNGATVNSIVRLNADGTRDTAFTTNTGTGASSTVRATSLQSDGKILVGGFFTTWNGATVNYIVRLNANGTRDTAFTTNTGTAANNLVYAIAAQPDGKILVGGDLTTFNGTTVNRIVRLNANGTRDTAFTTNTGAGANGVIYAIAVQSEGGILVGGFFTGYNEINRSNIFRIGSELAI
jgi:uncharacterized delta-60 repeat protein